jgi:SAM-dependent methyltransferase
LRNAVGPTGQVIGFDQSPEMLAQAREKVAAEGWHNVELHLCGVAELPLPATPVDALLFHYTHDILRSPAAVARLLTLARPGARVSVAGIKYFAWPLAWLNPWVYWKNRGYNGSPGELSTPWDHLAPRLVNWQRQDTQWGMGYLASGQVPGT